HIRTGRPRILRTERAGDGLAPPSFLLRYRQARPSIGRRQIVRAALTFRGRGAFANSVQAEEPGRTRRIGRSTPLRSSGPPARARARASQSRHRRPAMRAPRRTRAMAGTGRQDTYRGAFRRENPDRNARAARSSEPFSLLPYVQAILRHDAAPISDELSDR